MDYDAERLREAEDSYVPATYPHGLASEKRRILNDIMAGRIPLETKEDSIRLTGLEVEIGEKSEGAIEIYTSGPATKVIISRIGLDLEPTRQITIRKSNVLPLAELLSDPRIDRIAPFTALPLILDNDDTKHLSILACQAKRLAGALNKIDSRLRRYPSYKEYVSMLESNF